MAPEVLPRQLAIGYASALATVVIWAGFILLARLGGKSGLTAGTSWRCAWARRR
jgi:hypothetical protein